VTNRGGAVADAGGGATQFRDSSSASSGTFINEGGKFGQTPSGASGGGITMFLDTSTAGDGRVVNNGGTVNGAFGGVTEFEDNSNAGNGTLLPTAVQSTAHLAVKPFSSETRARAALLLLRTVGKLMAPAARTRYSKITLRLATACS
jgi:hypothetical protein